MMIDDDGWRRSWVLLEPGNVVVAWRLTIQWNVIEITEGCAELYERAHGDIRLAGW